jgi:hypothetical protein
MFLFYNFVVVSNLVSYKSRSNYSMSKVKFFLRYPGKLKVSVRTLLFIASGVWLFAGSMLLFRGITSVDYSLKYLWWILPACGVAGIISYVKMFSQISGKHVERIKSMHGAKYPVYYFFNKRSYILMFSMISLGIILRKLNFFSFTYLALFYIVMGIPLFISSFRFIRAAIRFHL